MKRNLQDFEKIEVGKAVTAIVGLGGVRPTHHSSNKRAHEDISINSCFFQLFKCTVANRCTAPRG